MRKAAQSGPRYTGRLKAPQHVCVRSTWENSLRRLVRKRLAVVGFAIVVQINADALVALDDVKGDTVG